MGEVAVVRRTTATSPMSSPSGTWHDAERAVDLQDGELDLTEVGQAVLPDRREDLVFGQPLAVQLLAIELAVVHDDGRRADDSRLETGPTDEQEPERPAQDEERARGYDSDGKL